MNEKILIVEDDQSIRNFLEISLNHMDYKHITASTLKEAYQLYTSQSPDLVLLDLGLPDGDGIEFIKDIRVHSTVPIIVISARGQEHAKIEALDLGADDYITKPFSTGELMARIRVCLRHHLLDTTKSAPTLIRIKDLEIDLEKYSVSIKNTPIKLTPIEYKLLALLAKNAGKVLVHKAIIKEVWGLHYEDTQSLRVFMASLRRKIEEDPTNPQYIITEIGIGYKIIDE
ncbi:MAG: response regulator [Candidatus Izemoplasmataceae bacterium]